MRVLVVHNRYVSGVPSGENVVVDEEIASLRSAGVDVEPYLRSSDEIATMGTRRRMALPLSPTWASETLADLRRRIAGFRPDVVHLHNPYPLISPGAVRVAHRAGVPVVQTVHNYRHVCMNGLYFRDGHVCHDCRGRAVPWPGVQHGCYRGSRPQSVAMAASLTLHRSTWQSVDRYLALTDVIAAHLRDYGIEEKRITIRPNTVDDPGFAAGEGEGFLFVGRLRAEKGVETLLDAWSRAAVGELGSLTVVGDGPLGPAVRDVADSRDDLHYAGELPHAEVLRAIAAAGAVVVPSVWPDVFPRVVVEALAVGRPVVATDIGGFPSIVTPEVGWLAPAGNPAALLETLRVARGESVAKIAAARARYEGNYSSQRVMQQLLDVYRDVASRGVLSA